MPISTAATSSRGRNRGAHRLATADGFTLIELGLVLLIIAVVLTLVIPRFQDQSRAELISQTRKLAATFRFLQSEAILNGRTYQLSLDLDQQRYFVTSSDAASQGNFQRENGLLAHDVALPNAVQIADVDLPMTLGKVYEGPAFINFYPDGYIDPSVVHLDNGQEVYTLYVPDGITGRAYVASGYVDLGAHS